MSIKEGLLVKSLRDLLINNPSLSQSQQHKPQISSNEYKLNLLFVEGTSEKLRHLLRSHKI